MPTSTDGQQDPTASQDDAQAKSTQQQDGQPETVLEDLELESTEELESVKGGFRSPYA
jgi:hypothetical protein